MIKNLFIILVGIVIGGVVSGVVGYRYISKQTSTTASPVTEQAIQTLYSIDESKEVLNRLNTLKFPKTQGVRGNLNSASSLSFNIIQTALQEVIQITTSNIYPNLTLLREKTAKSDWRDIFSLMKDLKVSLSENTSRITEAETELSKLESLNDIRFKPYIEATRNFIDANLVVYANLDAILIGEIPAKAKVDVLNASLTDLQIKSTLYETRAKELVNQI